MAASNLTLVVPPLSLPGHERDKLLHKLQLAGKSIDSLRRLVSRADNEKVEHQSLALCDLFGLPFNSLEELPLATLRASGNGFDSTTGYWFCAEPVHLEPDLDHVVLFEFPDGAVTRHELAQLVEEIQPLLHDMALAMHVGYDQRIYVRTGDIPAVTFAALDEVSGKNILPFLPDGEDASRWRLLMNEIQMTLAQSRVNRVREESGSQSVNGLWFWGGGFLLPKRYAQRYDQVMTADYLTRGLANFTATKLEPACNGFAEIDAGKNTLVTFDAGNNPDEIANTLINLDENWVAPAMQALKKNALGSLVILAGDYRFTIGRKQLGRFWKRRVKDQLLVDYL